MDAEQARRTLTDERRRLDELASRARAQTPEPAVEEEGSLGQHPGDVGTEVEEQMEGRGMADDADRQRADIDEALRRIDEGTWGTCVVCGREIDAERLEARPQAVRCMEHQQELERSAS